MEPFVCNVLMIVKHVNLKTILQFVLVVSKVFIWPMENAKHVTMNVQLALIFLDIAIHVKKDTISILKTNTTMDFAKNATLEHPIVPNALLISQKEQSFLHVLNAKMVSS